MHVVCSARFDFFAKACRTYYFSTLDTPLVRALPLDDKQLKHLPQLPDQILGDMK